MHNGDLRLCKKCEIEKPIGSFSLRKAPNGVPYRRNICNTCRHKRWKVKGNNRDKINANSKKAKDKYRVAQPDMRRQLMEHIDQVCCKTCAITDMRMLCFHHRIPSQKSFNIKWGFTHSYSLDSLKNEAAKCDVLCHNCHTLLHYKGTKPRRDAMKMKLMQAIGQTSCKRCQFDNPVCMSFHHRVPAEKLFGIADRLCWFPFDTLLTEAIKCDILCRNCHVAEHYPNFPVKGTS